MQTTRHGSEIGRLVIEESLDRGEVDHDVVVLIDQHAGVDVGVGASGFQIL